MLITAITRKELNAMPQELAEKIVAAGKIVGHHVEISAFSLANIKAAHGIPLDAKDAAAQRAHGVGGCMGCGE